MSNGGDMKNYFGAIIRFVSMVFFVLVTDASALDLQSAYELALKNDPNLQKAFSEYSAAKELKSQAVSKLLPIIGANAEYIHTGQEIVSSDNQVFGSGSTEFPTYIYSLTLNQPLFRLDSVVGYSQAKKQVLHAESLLKIAEQEMIIQVVDSYLQVLSAKDRLSAAKAEKTAVLENYESVRIGYESGRLPITELYDAKARLSQVLAGEIESQHFLDDAINALQEFTDSFDEKIFVLKEDIDFPSSDPDDIEIWTQKALDQNINLISKKLAVQVAKDEVKRQKAGHMPSLDLSGKFNYNETEGSLFGGGSEVETAEVAVSLNIPIFQGGYISSKTREAAHFLTAAQKDSEKEHRAVYRFVRSSFQGLKSSIDRVNALKESVKSFALASEAKLEGFNSHLYPFLSYLDAIRDLEVAKQEYARARYDYILNSLKLKQAAGILGSKDILFLSDWFEEPANHHMSRLNPDTLPSAAAISAHEPLKDPATFFFREALLSFSEVWIENPGKTRHPGTDGDKAVNIADIGLTNYREGYTIHR